MERGNEDGYADLGQSPMTRNRHSVATKLKKQSLQPTRPITRALGTVPSISVTTQIAADELANRKKAVEVQKIIEKALRNSLILKNICLFLNSDEDLSNARLVNRLFQAEATKKLKTLHEPIDIMMKMDEFIDDMKYRLTNEPHLFPFSSFIIDIEESVEVLEEFVAIVGPHARRYELRQRYIDPKWIQPPSYSSAGIGKRFRILLSGSPKLMEIKSHTTFRTIYLTNKDAARIPAVLPNLRIIDIDCERRVTPPNLPALIPVLVSRAVRLDSLRIPKCTEIPGMMTLARILAEKHRHHIPRLVFGQKLKLEPNSVVHIQELLELNLGLKDISFRLYGEQRGKNRTGYSENFRLLVQKVSTLLRTQMNTLISLTLTIDWQQQTPFTFDLPPFLALTDLRLGFPEIDQPNQPANPRIFLPLTQTELPVLRKLRFFNYTEELGLVGSTVLPAVRKLLLLCQDGSLTDRFWQETFPNLTYIRIEVICAAVTAVPNLSFVLTRFPRVTDLNISLQIHYGVRGPDYWDLLTGSAVRPASIYALYHENFAAQVGEPLEPVNGVFQVPSLRNMRGLKTFKFSPGCRSNLDAILYMTRAGLLGPLEKLVLCNFKWDLKDLPRGVKKTYWTKLDAVHKDVEFC